MRSKKLVLVLAAALVAGLVGITGSASAAGQDEAYANPPFAQDCTWHRYGDGVWASPSLLRARTLCVEYSKRDITVDNGGAIMFLLAEPSRFAVALPACKYWQLDHWQVRLASGHRPLLSWDGSYWFDKDHGAGGVRLTNFRLAGTPVGAGDAAAALRPTLPRVADLIGRYGDKAGESGISLDLPAGVACQR